MQDKYVPSGTASATGVLKTILFGILASLILPILYIILNKLVPNIWFAAISAGLLGVGLGFFIDLGIKIGKIRNLKIAIGIALCCGLLAFYVQWTVFDELMYSEKGFTFKLNGTDLKILLEDSFFLFTHPGILFKEIAKLNEVGTFRIESSGTISGVLLWVIWFGEFLVILGSILFSVIYGRVSEPFSELTDTWMEKRKPSIFIPHINDKRDLLDQLERRNYSVLKQKLEDPNSHTFAEVIVFEAPDDPLKFVNVSNTHITRDKKGKEKVKKDSILKYYPVTQRDF